MPEPKLDNPTCYCGMFPDLNRLHVNTPSENIVIRNCTVIHSDQLVAIGSEPSGGVRNVYVHDCRFDARTKPFNLLFIKTNRRRGGFVEDITMENIEATSTQFGVLGIETDVLYQ
jgi:polygalacturonase